mmetsp:Transcript_6086/g.17043  ORF Transcript_6086/g.17043 Transcript_6086/m.17043 type:complete len:104 (-) Transcript_6086:82-393(-)
MSPSNDVIVMDGSMYAIVYRAGVGSMKPKIQIHVSSLTGLTATQGLAQGDGRPPHSNLSDCTILYIQVLRPQSRSGEGGSLGQVKAYFLFWAYIHVCVIRTYM